MSDPAIDQLTEGLDGLSVKAGVEEVAAPVKVKAEDDDGYNSANSEEVVSTSSKKSEEDEEEEKELEPLSFVLMSTMAVQGLYLLVHLILPLKHKPCLIFLSASSIERWWG